MKTRAVIFFGTLLVRTILQCGQSLMLIVCQHVILVGLHDQSARCTHELGMANEIRPTSQEEGRCLKPTPPFALVLFSAMMIFVIGVFGVDFDLKSLGKEAVFAMIADMHLQKAFCPKYSKVVCSP